MKSIEQANDLVSIIEASGGVWSHELARQKNKRMSSLLFAETRQLERWNFSDGWQRADSSRKLDEIKEARSNLCTMYDKAKANKYNKKCT